MTLQRAPGARRVFGRAGTDGSSRTPSGAPSGGHSGSPSGGLSGFPSRTPTGPSGPSGASGSPSGAPSNRVSRGITTTTDPALSTTDRYRLGTWPPQLHPELEEFLNYWESKRGSHGQLPSRAQIDPSEIPTLLTGIALFDVERVVAAPGYRFKYRLLGTRHSAVNQADFSGRYIEDVHYPDEAIPIIGAFCLVVERRLPHYWNRERVSKRDPSVRIPYERIVVPLASDGVNVNMLFAHYVFHNQGDSWHWWREGNQSA
jgi:hypothetical protein